MKLFRTKADSEVLLLRYRVYREDELIMSCAMLDDAISTVDKYASNVEHAGALMLVRDSYSWSKEHVVYSKRSDPRDAQVVVPFVSPFKKG
jgi:hypothetical protein